MGVNQPMVSPEGGNRGPNMEQQRKMLQDSNITYKKGIFAESAPYVERQSPAYEQTGPNFDPNLTPDQQTLQHNTGAVSQMNPNYDPNRPIFADEEAWKRKEMEFMAEKAKREAYAAQVATMRANMQAGRQMAFDQANRPEQTLRDKIFGGVTGGVSRLSDYLDRLVTNQ